MVATHSGDACRVLVNAHTITIELGTLESDGVARDVLRLALPAASRPS